MIRKIGIDLDGTVINNTPAFLDVTRSLGYRLARWQVNSNILKHTIPLEHSTVAKKHVYEKERGKEEPFAGALDFIRDHAELVSIVSVQKQPISERKVLGWLRRHGVLAVIPRSRIHLVRTREDKIKRLAQLQLDAFIDDGLDVLQYVPHGTYAVMFDPFRARQRISVPDRITPVSSWRQVRRLLDLPL